MPQYDSLLQQIPYPVLTDKPNAQQAFQALTEAVAAKLVMTFASASVRGAAITTPVGGMMTYLKDTGLLQYFDANSGQWVTLAAGTTQWTNIPLVAGYSTTDNNDQGPVQYRAVNMFGETSLMFRGGVHVTYTAGAPANGGRWNTNLLPSTLRPAYKRTISLACSASNSTTSTVKLDINPDGSLVFIGISDADDSPPWISLNGAVCPL